jgi:hypothetical protein
LIIRNPYNPLLSVCYFRKKERKGYDFPSTSGFPQMGEKKSGVTGKVWKESKRKRIGVWRAPERERDG